MTCEIEAIIVWLVVISCWIIFIVHCYNKRIINLEQTLKNSVIWKLPENTEFIPTEKPFITENGRQSTEEINEKLKEFAELIVKLQRVGTRMNLRLRSLEEKFDDDELKALSDALDKRDHKQGKQIDSNLQRLIKLQKELKEMAKRIG